MGRKMSASKSHRGVASLSNHGDEIIRDADLDDMTDRKRKIRKLREKGKPFLLQRISKMTWLRDYLAIEENEELVNDFSNKLIWVKPLKYEFMDRKLPQDVIDKYIDDLVASNPKLPKSVGVGELDQNRGSDSDFANPNFEDEEGTKIARIVSARLVLVSSCFVSLAKCMINMMLKR